MDITEYRQIPNTKYLINREGNVIRKFKNGNISILKHHKNKRNGYYYVFCGNKKSITVHRALGLCFIDNPHNYKIIDHIDRNRTNNNLNNLRWVSVTQNRCNSITVLEAKGCIYKTTDKHIINNKQHIYNGYRAAIYINFKRKSKRFKKKEDAEKWLKEQNKIKYSSSQ